MKRRCVPLRGDHNLLTPDTHTLSGVRLPPVIQVRLEGVASHPGHLSDSSSSKLAVGLPRRRLEASPTRRLRFEDETETEAESRYLERQRQRRWVGQRGTGVLVSKPDLSLYISSRVEAGLQRAEHDVDRQRRGQTPAGGVGAAGPCDSCGTVLGGGVNLNLPDGRGRSLCRPHVNLRTEPIRETYIGSITLGKATPWWGGRGRADLPINPYAPDQLTTPTSRCPSSSSPSLVTSSMMPQSIKLNGTQAGQTLTQDQGEQGRPAGAKPHREHRAGAERRTRSPCVEEAGGVELRMKNSSSSSSERSSDSTADYRPPPISESSSNGQVKDPIRAELQNDEASLPEHLGSRDESSRLSLRRLFSTVKLSRTRTRSLDRLSNRPCPSVSDPAPSSLLKKCPSVQSLNEGSAFLHLKKFSSLQSFGSEQKKKDRSADYRPAADRFLQRSLSVEDVGRPCSLRSVGRVLEAASDGTFLLELSRPTTGKYGFVISRGKGRPDSGVYVEDMVDSSTEKLYAGLLSVGDEILEVNGEKVVCLSLDQVIHLLTQNVSATVRVLRLLKTVPR
ncbi:hypothetical protein INR49_019450 [Caranx melampygus]|nr:hypothetical protein INR49_019450 [Caranx melampygus]